ncbi:MAG: GNAT family N-acetyltransferase [Alphaproteobacteria bacterium]|nr:GNAT family N-acetyltransferase [Alphaproteobacteria bacterium]
MSAAALDTVRLDAQPFDARFVGGPVFRMTTTDAADAGRIRSALATLDKAVKLVSARVPAGASALRAALEACGFVAIERLVTFERTLESLPGALPEGVRPARPGDETACAAIGRTAFRFDRYHADARLDPAIGDALKEAWVLNDLAGRAETCLVAVEADEVVGFNLCLLAGEVATIDLIAVATGRQGRGIGSRLTEAGARHYAGRARAYRAGTQATNAPSMALYRRLGFRAVAEAVTYHWMPGDTGSNR